MLGDSDYNVLTGSAGADKLDSGGGGIDTLVGGTGNDTDLIGGSGTETIIELSGEGTNTVRSSRSYTLGNNLENLLITGINSSDASGNELGNVIGRNHRDNLIDDGDG